MNRRALSVRPDGVHGVLEVPGSKSHANRCLVCASLADGLSRLEGLPDGDDTSTMLAALDRLGLGVDREDGAVVVRGPLPVGDEDEVTLWAGLGGTTSRFLTALAALREGPSIVDGEAPLRGRPMGPLHDALRDLGHEVRALGVRGRLPVRVSRAAARGGLVGVGAETSSQFLSALMMTGPVRNGGLVIEVEGTFVSRPYVDMTTAVMRSFGADVRWSASDTAVRCEIVGEGYRPATVRIEPDASSGAYGAAAAAIAGGSVRIRGLASVSLQPDLGFLQVLGEMGCAVAVDGRDVVVSRDPGVALRSVDVDMGAMSDQVPTLAAVAATARGTTVIRGVGFIRNKESDRLGDLAAGLSAVGIRAEVTDDGLEVRGGSPRAGLVDPHDDHRLAMSIGLLGLATEGIEVSDPSVVGKSWPNYWSAIEAL